MKKLSALFFVLLAVGCAKIESNHRAAGQTNKDIINSCLDASEYLYCKWSQCSGLSGDAYTTCTNHCYQMNCVPG